MSVSRTWFCKELPTKLTITLISDQRFDAGWASTLHLMGGKPTGGLDSGDPHDNIMLIVLIIATAPLYIEIFNVKS